MKDEIIKFETAKLAKEKGFNWKVENYFYDEFHKQTIYKDKLTDYSKHEKGNLYECVSAPTQSLLQRWLREKHNLHIVIIPTVTSYFTYKILDIQLNPENPIERPPYKDVASEDFTTYELSLEGGLQEALKII